MPPTNTEIQQENENITLSRLVNLYIEEVTSKCGHDISKGIEKNFLRFLEIVGNKPISHCFIEDQNSRRIIPLNPALLKFGLVEYSQSLSGSKLFPDIKLYKGKYSHQVSRDFS